MTLPTTVDAVIARMEQIDAGLSAGDGVGDFNRMYLTVTQQIAAIIGEPGAGVGAAPGAGPAAGAPTFHDPQLMAGLDVTFAGLWLTAVDADAAKTAVSPAWRPLFEARRGGRLPVQYAIAGMNSHIEHDLPVAVVTTCAARGLTPDEIHAGYLAVNAVLAQVESTIRRSFLDAVERQVDDRLGPIVHLISTWDIDHARDLAWVTAQTIWELRATHLLYDAFLDGLSHTVGMTSRALLVPTSVPPGSWPLDV